MNDKILLWISLSVSFFLIIAKGVTAFITGSVALFSSMLDSFMDTFSTLMNVILYHESQKPADKEHPFGHGKFEGFAALLQSLFIMGSAVWIFSSAVSSLISPQNLESEGLGIFIMIISIITPIVLSWFLKKHASAHSLILEAEGEHFASDGILNASVLFGIFSSFLWNTSFIDSLVGIGAALFIFYRSITLLKTSISVLVDETLPHEIQEEIINILHQQKGILGWHNLRTRRSGSEFHADVHLEFPENILLKDAHGIAEKLENTLCQKYPNLIVLTHFDISKDNTIILNED